MTELVVDTVETTKLVDQPTLAPSRKVTAGIIGSALTVVLMWILGYFGVATFPAGVESAITALITVGVAYVTRDRLLIQL